jgi:hypothetical protein
VGGTPLRKGVKIVIRSVAVVLVVAVATGVVMRTRYERGLARQVDQLFAARVPDRASVVADKDLTGLPEPVQLWLRSAGIVGQPRPTTVRLKQAGEIRLGDRGWLPFTAEEYYTIDPPGFVWTASIDMAPLVAVIGQDRFVAGKGNLEMRVLGVIPVANDSGADMDQGELLRYLNEIMWFPAAALSPYITWESIDTTSALATIQYAGLKVSATFVFDDQGRLTTMTADRFDREYGAIVPWSTPITAYGIFNGINIPIAGEAVYTRDTGDFSYIRLRVTALDSNQPSRF